VSCLRPGEGRRRRDAPGAQAGDEQEAEPAERPCQQHRDVPAGGGPVEEAGAAQEVPSGSGRHELADRAGRLRQHLGAEPTPENRGV
jgi:hypothetical protein